ncbi:HD domain-containing phosphohydrolase [Undibacterium sp.]|uniref:HD domain-containing phosphohydrolase n=1 Tax=Undibacterium sp. TaxID=1914977 RepID=UPI0025E9D13C|nr:HD domain-containing phosphohydrolase [Undibacterium sp.]
MELFALNQDVLALESRLALLEGSARLDTLIALAWALRQRDCEAALRLVEQAEALLNDYLIEDAKLQGDLARLLLIKGEVNWLFADLAQAEQQAMLAISIFERLGNHIGAGDAKWLLASVWLDRGDVQHHAKWLELATSDYAQAGDTQRVAIAHARALHFAAFLDAPGTSARIAELFDLQQEQPAAVMAWLASALALVPSLSGDQVTAIRAYSQAHLAARDSGQLRQAILNASNGADAFATLGDLDAALEWDEHALALARGTGWPSMVGNTLMQTGNVLRLLGRREEAKAILLEAQSSMRELTSSKSYTMTLQYLGDLALDSGEPQAALEYFRQVEERITSLGEPYFLLRCWRGQANALCRLAQPQEASAKVAAAFALASREGSADEQIKALRIYAELYHLHPLPAPEGMASASPSLHFLNQALAVAATINGYILPSELLDEVANAYALIGNYRLAYSYSQSAAAARDNKRLADAGIRAVAMQVRQETERAYASARYHQQLAINEASRASYLQETNTTLETLGLIGREMTANLNKEAVFATFYRHVRQLLDVASFSISLLDEDGVTLKGSFCMEHERALLLSDFSVHDESIYTARCARERQEILINIRPDEDLITSSWIEGSLDTRSLLFAPLLAGERLLGVMSIQSIHTHAYAERESAIFRTLCSYAAIALENAAAYAMVDSAQLQANAALQELGKAREKLADHAEWLAEEVSKATGEITQRERETVYRLSKAAEYRDRETGAHILRMAHYSELIAKGLGLSVADRELLLEAAPMHDIGKVGIADHILLKPRRLDGEEFEVMKQHALYGYEILKESSSKVLQAGAAIARGHHEKYDGSGYPYGLKGQQIPIFSRIVAVADVFDALTSERPYKKAWPLEAAADYLKANSGSHFDPDCVATFFDHWDEVLHIRERFQDEH